MNAIPQIQNYTCPFCGGFIGEAAPIGQVREAVTSPTQSTILEMLSRSIGKPVMREAIMDRVYGDRADGGPDQGATTLMVHVSLLRRKIEPFGWTISVSRGGAGNTAQWRLIPTIAGV